MVYTTSLCDSLWNLASGDHVHILIAMLCTGTSSVDLVVTHRSSLHNTMSVITAFPT